MLALSDNTALSYGCSQAAGDELPFTGREVTVSGLGWSLIINIVPIFEYYEQDRRLSGHIAGVEAMWLATNGMKGKILAGSVDDAIELCIKAYRTWVEKQAGSQN